MSPFSTPMPPPFTPTVSTPSATQVPTAAFTPTWIPPTATPTNTPTATWVYQPAGRVACLILLYHDVFDIQPPTLYYILPASFETEMDLLHEWGYTTIPISLLVQAITLGAALPPGPVVITFEDGDEDVYTNAFRIMQRLGFSAVLYLGSNWSGAKGFLSVPEITQMVSAGWEVGDHSLTLINLVDNPGLLNDQAVQSRTELRADLGLPIDTFTYPFGLVDK